VAVAEEEFTAEQLAAGERLFARPWHFVLGAPVLEALPPADRPEIAFAGRSNVGKSSLINALVRQKGLARTSNTPGRTQELNFFAVFGVDAYLVDMPGYGYAKAPKDKVAAWTDLVRNYLRGRSSLKRVLVLIDARHGIKAADEPIMEMLDEAAVSFQIVLTKADKIPPLARASVLAKVEAVASRHPAAHPVVRLTSADTGLGIDLLRAEIAQLITGSRA
jgi:GTP-binding protein